MAARKKVTEQTPHILRDERGLIKTVEHKFNQFGFVDWREMVNSEYIFLNKYNLAAKGIDVEILEDEERKNLIESAEERDLVIGLEGFRELARLRGIKKIETHLGHKDEHSTSVTVTIEWISNFEYPEGLVGSATAGANLNNTDGAYANYLETIAENRAFCRAVRHSLGIASPAQEEIKWDDKVDLKKDAPDLATALSKLLQENNIPFEKFQSRIQEQEMFWDEKWKTPKDIPNEYVFKFYNYTKKRLDELKAKNE